VRASLPHQGLWFILLLIVILLLLSKNVATHLRPAGDGGQAMDDQWVMAYNSMLIPIA
jgi:hypothetical protein